MTAHTVYQICSSAIIHAPRSTRVDLRCQESPEEATRKWTRWRRKKTGRLSRSYQHLRRVKNWVLKELLQKLQNEIFLAHKKNLLYNSCGTKTKRKKRCRTRNKKKCERGGISSHLLKRILALRQWNNDTVPSRAPFSVSSILYCIRISHDSAILDHGTIANWKDETT